MTRDPNEEDMDPLDRAIDEALNGAEASDARIWHADCSDCDWTYQDSRKWTVEAAADSHQVAYAYLPEDHHTSTWYINAETARMVGDSHDA